MLDEETNLETEPCIQKNLQTNNPTSTPTSGFIWAGLGIDVILFTCALIMLSNTGSSGMKRAGGAYAWAKTLLSLTGVSLTLVSVLGLVATVGTIFMHSSLLIQKISRSILIAQVISIVVVVLVQILALCMFFSFFGALQSSPSTVADVKYPVFSNFANCTWNTCCALTHVRERSFVKLDCNLRKTGVADLTAVCLNLPRESSNATACTGGVDGLVDFRVDVSTWIFSEVMSWSRFFFFGWEDFVLACCFVFEIRYMGEGYSFQCSSDSGVCFNFFCLSLSLQTHLLCRLDCCDFVDF